MMRLMRHLSPRAIIGILIAANAVLLVVLTLQIGERFLYEVSGAFNGDSPIYWTVGRGLVNGLTLYRDLFDIKPPGIFLVSALSYAVTDSMRLGHLIQGLVIALLPLTMLLPIFLMQKQQNTSSRLFGFLMALAFIGSMTMYVAFSSGEFQTESFGVLFACAYTGTALMLRDRQSRLLTIIAGIFFFGCILFKEPFLISAIAAGLLLSRSIKDVVRIVIIPCCIGLVLLGLTFLFMGALDSYLTTYLPFMMGERTKRFGSPYSRAMMIEGAIVDMMYFSPALCLSITLLWLWTLTTRMEVRWNSPRTVFAGIAFLLGLVMLNYGLQSVRLFSWAQRIWTMRQSPPWILVGLITACGSGYALYQLTGKHPRMIIRTAIALFGIFAVGYVTGLSGEFLGHHMIFAVPIYMALMLIFIETSFASESFYSPSSLLLGALLIIAVFMHDVTEYTKKLPAMMTEQANDRALATYIDTVMDACKLERYLIFGEMGSNVFGYTKHSPSGPIFFQHSLIRVFPPFTMAYVHQLSSAEMLVTWIGSTRGESIPGITAYVHHDFSAAPRACAPITQDPKGRVQLLFRTKKSKIDLNVMADGYVNLAFTPDGAVESE